MIARGYTSRNKVDGHVQNWSGHLTTGGTTNRWLTDIIKCGDVSGVHITPRDGSCHRSSKIIVGRTTARTTSRTMTDHQQKDQSQYATASGVRSKHCRSVARPPNHNQSYDQQIVRSGVTVALLSRSTSTARVDTLVDQMCRNIYNKKTRNSDKLY